jgi:hypothetical protein
LQQFERRLRLRQEHDEAVAMINYFKQSRQYLIKCAREAELSWMSAMRKVTYLHECMLGDAGVMNDEAPARWTDEDYIYDSFLRSENDPNTIYDVNGAHEGSDDQCSQPSSYEEIIKRSEEEVMQDRHDMLYERIKECQKDVSITRTEHDQYRVLYGQLFNEYAAECPGRTKADMEE